MFLTSSSRDELKVTVSEVVGTQLQTLYENKSLLFATIKLNHGTYPARSQSLRLQYPLH